MNKWGFWLPPVDTICPRCGYPKQTPSPVPCGMAPHHDQEEKQ